MSSGGSVAPNIAGLSESLESIGSIEQLRMKLRELLAGVADTAALDADLLLMDALGCNRAQLLMAADQSPTSQQMLRLAANVSRRGKGEPMAYIFGRREFWSLELAVTDATLIPRPETELLVEIALNQLQRSDDRVIRVADLGTGSGAIALALARECPDWELVATDKSQAALDIATANARSLGIDNVEFRCGNWFVPITGEKFDLIISNPPYVAADDPCLSQGDTSQEPRTALAAGADGLADLQQLIAAAAEFLFPHGALLLEHGHQQRAALSRLMAAAGWQQIEWFQDLAGLDRAVLARPCVSPTTI